MSCVIVSVCSALLVAMNHVTLYILYIYDTISTSASACYVHAHAGIFAYVCVYVVCVRAHVRLCARKACVYCTVCTSRCAYVYA